MLRSGIVPSGFLPEQRKHFCSVSPGPEGCKLHHTLQIFAGTSRLSWLQWNELKWIRTEDVSKSSKHIETYRNTLVSILQRVTFSDHLWFQPPGTCLRGSGLWTTDDFTRPGKEREENGRKVAACKPTAHWTSLRLCFPTFARLCCSSSFPWRKVNLWQTIMMSQLLAKSTIKRANLCLKSSHSARSLPFSAPPAPGNSGIGIKKTGQMIMHGPKDFDPLSSGF